MVIVHNCLLASIMLFFGIVFRKGKTTQREELSESTAFIFIENANVEECEVQLGKQANQVLYTTL